MIPSNKVVLNVKTGKIKTTKIPYETKVDTPPKEVINFEDLEKIVARAKTEGWL